MAIEGKFYPQLTLWERWQSGGGLGLKRCLISRNFHDLLPRDTPGGRLNHWGRAYHGDETQHREQTEVEGTHSSLAVLVLYVRC